MPSSPEEEAFRRQAANVAIEPEEMVLFQVPQSVLHEALVQTVRDELRHSPAIRDWLGVKIREYVAELGPQSEHLDAIKEEVREHLNRYPSLGSDLRLQEKVAMAIFGYIQGPNSRH